MCLISWTFFSNVEHFSLTQFWQNQIKSNNNEAKIKLPITSTCGCEWSKLVLIRKHIYYCITLVYRHTPNLIAMKNFYFHKDVLPFMLRTYVCLCLCIVARETLHHINCCVFNWKISMFIFGADIFQSYCNFLYEIGKLVDQWTPPSHKQWNIINSHSEVSKQKSSDFNSSVQVTCCVIFVWVLFWTLTLWFAQYCLIRAHMSCGSSSFVEQNHVNIV